MNRGELRALTGLRYRDPDGSGRGEIKEKQRACTPYQSFGAPWTGSKTVRRYATADQLICGPRLTRPGLLGPHPAYLRQRWDEGICSTELLHQELRERGYQGIQRTLRRLTSKLRQDTAVPAPPPAPAVRKVASWILTPPGKLTDGNRATLARITARCEELNTTRDLVREFADMLCHRHGEHLEARAAQAESSPVSELEG
jgi:hypothetical protein